MDHIASLFENARKERLQELIPELTNYFTPYFETNHAALEFVEKCENYPDPTFKRVLHQIHRAISLSDEMKHLNTPSTSDSLRIFFWIVCIEAIYKASHEESKVTKAEIVRSFFEYSVSLIDQTTLVKHISMMDMPPLSITSIADMFNTVRNMFAHEGIYWMFTFPTVTGENNMVLLPKPRTQKLSTYTMGTEKMDTYIISISGDDVRNIIIRGALQFLQKLMESENSPSK